MNEDAKDIESSCCKYSKKSPNQETGLENRGHMKVSNDNKIDP